VNIRLTDAERKAMLQLTPGDIAQWFRSTQAAYAPGSVASIEDAVGAMAMAMVHGNLIADRMAGLRLIDEDTPHNRFLLLAGPSGSYITPLRFIVAKHYKAYRPHQPWIDHAGDSVLDGGEMPTHWMEIPTEGIN
jgi:hypothetical protein